MKIVLLSAGNSIHTIRWANGLVSRGLKVYLLSATSKQAGLDDRVIFYSLRYKAPAGYLLNFIEVIRILREIQPDLLNAHYATGYGLLARLINFKPTVLSVWGSDIYDFPERSVLHRWLLKGNLKFPTAIASTSHCMARKTAENYAHKKIYITPFGVDENIFYPIPRNSKNIVFGTVKILESKYGVDILIKAFAVMWEKLGFPEYVKLEIAGSGSDLEKLKDLSKKLGLLDNIFFHGKVDHCDVPKILNQLDVYCAFSRLESFGVAILEACACEKPVIVSNASGLEEVTVDKVTGYVVPIDDIESSANAMISLARNKNLRESMGRSGRQHIIENYTWEKSLDLMIDVYKKITLAN